MKKLTLLIACLLVLSVMSFGVTIKIIIHTNPATVDALNAINEKFTAKYPDIKVDMTDVPVAQYPQLKQSRIAAGDVDIIENQTGFDLTPQSFMKGVNVPDWLTYIQNGDFLEISDQPFVKNWNPAAIKEACTYNGKVYQINMGTVAFNGIFYSKDIFDKYGLKVPVTWTEFITICKTLKSKGIAPMTSGAKDQWPINMMSSAFVAAQEADAGAFVKDLWTGKRKFNDAQSLKIFNKMAEWGTYFEQGVTSVGYSDVIGRFVAGKAAMMPDGSWQGANIEAADASFKYGYFAIPGDTKGKIPPQLAGKYDIGFVVYAKSSNKDAALKWMDFISQKENYTELINAIAFIPTMPGVTMKSEFVNSLAPINQQFRTAWERYFVTPKGLGKYGGFNPMQLKVFGGDVATPKELANLAQKDWDDALKSAQ